MLIVVLTVTALPETLPPQRRRGGGLRVTAAAAREVSPDRLFVAATGEPADPSGFDVDVAGPGSEEVGS